MLKTKVDIVSGFLGAGKTTFIKKILEEGIKKEQTVLIENEFGEIGIDGGFLKNSGIEIREMNSGCICCSLVGDFSENLKEILKSYHPERIIIEPSGVGKLSDVINAVGNVEADFGLKNNAAVTIVDAKKIKMYAKNFGEFFNNQIENAKLIVLSRTDIMDGEKIAEAVESVKKINPNAKIIDTPIAELSGEKLLDLMENEGNLESRLLEEAKQYLKSGAHHHEHEHGEECACGCSHDHHHEQGEDCGCHEHDHHHEHGEECACGCSHDHHHHADEIFESWGAEQLPPIRKEKLEELLEEFAEGSDFGIVLRAKGMLREEGSDKWLYFDLVPGEVLIREGEPEYTGKVCVIGTNLRKEELKHSFLALS
ncbi:MAG: GTP-binding protein [Johnsonella sp.]|nr:GTP-binding protein [Johnsonella sp.]